MYTRRRQSVRRNQRSVQELVLVPWRTLRRHRSVRIQQGCPASFALERFLERSPSPVEPAYRLNPRPWRTQLVSSAPLEIKPRSRVPDAVDSSASLAMRLRPSNVAPALTTRTGAWTSPETEPVG